MITRVVNVALPLINNRIALDFYKASRSRDLFVVVVVFPFVLTSVPLNFVVNTVLIQYYVYNEI